MYGLILFFVICTVGGLEFDDYDFASPASDNCDVKLEGSEWLLAHRRADYGWGDETHRALIALVVDSPEKWLTMSDKELMITQLQLELTRALVRNGTEDGMAIGELALYIHAFVATGLDPRDFYGEDLVAALRHKYLYEQRPNPFTVLALCNTRALDYMTLHKITNYLSENNSNSKSKEFKAIAVKAFACAFGENSDYKQKYEGPYKSAVASLVRSQKDDGSFGNFYTTSLVIQALVASEIEGWDEFQALEFIATNVTMVNIMSVYYSSLAWNSNKVKFVKDLTKKIEPLITEDGFPSILELKRRPGAYFVQYTVKAFSRLHSFFSVDLYVPLNVTVFDVMRLASDDDYNFRFNYSLNANRQPEIYSISGIPNDPEMGYYWKLDSQGQVARTQQGYHPYPHNEGVNLLVPKALSRWTFVYTDLFP